MRAAVAVAALAASGLALAGCGNDDLDRQLPDAPRALRVEAPDLGPGGRIPRELSCDGAGESPALRWSGVPSDARSMAIVVVDVDAPDGRLVHWLVGGLPPGDGGVQAGTVPSGARVAENSFGEREYEPPCPPEDDDAHRYVVTVYALSAPQPVPEDADFDEALDAIEPVALATGSVTGRYER